MQKILMVLIGLIGLIGLVITLHAEIALPEGGNDNDILVKNGANVPENHFHYKFLTPNKNSFIGSTDTGLITDYPIKNFAKAEHKHETKDITNLADYKAIRATLADKSLEATHAEKADNATQASAADYATKADEANTAKAADNGLSASAAVGTVPIKTANGWGYTTPDIPQQGHVNQVLAKNSEKDFDVGWKTRTVLPEPVKDCVYYVDANGKGTMRTLTDLREEAYHQYYVCWVWFLIAGILGTLDLIMLFFTIYWVATHTDKAVRG